MGSKRRDYFFKAVERKFGMVNCHYCNEKLEYKKNRTTIDHVTPLARGGTNGKYNLVWCCKTCNRDKGDKNYLYGSPG